VNGSLELYVVGQVEEGLAVSVLRLDGAEVREAADAEMGRSMPAEDAVARLPILGRLSGAPRLNLVDLDAVAKVPAGSFALHNPEAHDVPPAAFVIGTESESRKRAVATRSSTGTCTD